jgi:hypothetical protein
MNVCIDNYYSTLLRYKAFFDFTIKKYTKLSFCKDNKRSRFPIINFYKTGNPNAK